MKTLLICGLTLVCGMLAMESSLAEMPPEDVERGIRKLSQDVLRLKGVLPEQYEEELMRACRRGDRDRVRLLLSSGVDPNALIEVSRQGEDYVDVELSTPLVESISREQMTIAKILIEHGADVRKGSVSVSIHPQEGPFPSFEDGNWTPLHAAASVGNVSIARLLVDEGADVNAMMSHEGVDLSSFAVGAEESEKKIARAGRARYDAQGIPNWKEGTRPLHVAVEKGNDEMVRYLIAVGADVEARTENGSSPLHLAVVHGYDEVVKTLLRSGARVNAVNHAGQTPLSLASSSSIYTILKTAGGRK